MLLSSGPGVPGSSPLTRGKRRLLVGDRERLGLIPAHAGKTQACRAEPTSTRAHPRLRGETDAPFLGVEPLQGSSSLTRGKPRGEGAPCVPEGLIPTHAGKTKARAGTWSVSRAHPRSRGENDLVAEFLTRRPGSSPLTRGKRIDVATWWRTRGLIPAHAGKTFDPKGGNHVEGAHPRSRGENRIVKESQNGKSGSSPLTRGKPDPHSHSGCILGLIPAHAGKTPHRSSCAIAAAAHPRSRGENRLSNTTTLGNMGSSPLTRGKHVLAGTLGNVSGLIPAHAGKTAQSSTRTRQARAHPRSRGENARSAAAHRRQ